MPDFADGGYIKGEGIPLTFERVGVGPDGVCLYSINGAPPEPVIPANQLKIRALPWLDALRAEGGDDA